MRHLPLAALLALSGCAAAFAIRTDRWDYAPVLNSAPGLGMAPDFAWGRSAPAGLRYRWKADFGRFVRWAGPEHKVEELGAETANAGETVYWTYDPALMHQPKPEVHIELTAEDAAGKAVQKAGLKLAWDGDAAKVSP